MSQIERELCGRPFTSKAGRVLMSLTLAAMAAGPSPAHAAPPGPQDPVPVIVQNTPLPVAIANMPVAVVPAERAGMVVQGTVAASQVGPWTVELAPRKLFRGKVEYVSATLVNNTNEVLVIDRVSGQALDSQRYFQLEVLTTSGIQPLLLPATYVGNTVSWLVSATTQLYVMPGEELRVCCDAMTAYLSGHYEPLAQP
jgi:hypothetical protein